jgi:hypothetical protein
MCAVNSFKMTSCRNISCIVKELIQTFAYPHWKDVETSMLRNSSLLYNIKRGLSKAMCHAIASLFMGMLARAIFVV